MASIKLTYFDGRGRAEVSRLVLAAAGKKFDDVRVQQGEWPALKPKTPYGSLPVLEYNGKRYGQSIPIAIFLAKECGLYGKTNAEGLRIEEVVALVADFLPLVNGPVFESDAAKKAEKEKKLLEEDAPRFLGYFEALLKENGSSGYFVGKSITLADLAVYNITDTALGVKSDILAKFPLIKKLRENVSSQPKVKAYLAARKPSPF